MDPDDLLAPTQTRDVSHIDQMNAAYLLVTQAFVRRSISSHAPQKVAIRRTASMETSAVSVKMRLAKTSGLC